MKVFIFVDESGPFDEGLKGGAGKVRSSLVGGVCSTLSSKGWRGVHERTVENYNSSSRIKFTYPVHFHCAPLFRGDLLVPGGPRESDLTAFTQSVTNAVCENSLFPFASTNPAGRFEYSPQATYVMNLVTALRGAFDKLVERGIEVDSCEIVVAQRTIAETEQSQYSDYTSRLLKFALEQSAIGDSEGVHLARSLNTNNALRIRSAVGDRDAGLMAADFICSFIYEGRDFPVTPEIFKPEESMGGDFTAYYEREVRRLVKVGQYAAAAEFLRRYFPLQKGVPDYGPVLHALEKEKDPNVLHRELSGLLVTAEYLVERRTEEHHALESARRLLESLDRIAVRIIAKSKDPRVVQQWADVLVSGLVLLASCHNHVGAVGPQQEIEDRLKSALQDYGSFISRSYPERRELLLEARTRHLNLLFNDYRFSEVLDVFLADVEERESQIPEGESDELLGKMQGSIGQAFAFLARRDPACTEMAREYFEKSIRHFEPGVVYHSMAVNYLAALAWQEGNLDLACEEMNGHTRLADVSGPQDLVIRLAEIVNAGDVSPFDAINYLRIAASFTNINGPIGVDALKSILVEWEPRMTGDHPFEQFCKWLGFLFHQAREYPNAAGLYARALEICESLDFTVRTIGLPVLGLKAICMDSMGDSAGYASGLNQLREQAQDLANNSLGFADVLSASGGPEILVDLVKQRNAEAAMGLARYLPFNYA